METPRILIVCHRPVHRPAAAVLAEADARHRRRPDAVPIAGSFQHRPAPGARRRQPGDGQHLLPLPGRQNGRTLHQVGFCIYYCKCCCIYALAQFKWKRADHINIHTVHLPPSLQFYSTSFSLETSSMIFYPLVSIFRPQERKLRKKSSRFPSCRRSAIDSRDQEHADQWPNSEPGLLPWEHSKRPVTTALIGRRPGEANQQRIRTRIRWLQVACWSNTRLNWALLSSEYSLPRFVFRVCITYPIHETKWIVYLWREGNRVRWWHPVATSLMN